MTDKLHYQDVFTTINIPKTERRLALKAKNLFDIAAGSETWNPNVYAHLNKVTDTESASQAFWEFENNEEHMYDRLALTIMQRGLTIALEHRDFDVKSANIRKSLVISSGISKLYTTDLLGRGRIDDGTSSEYAVTLFKDNFLETTASLGLYNHIKQLGVNQNASEAAIFANAA